MGEVCGQDIFFFNICGCCLLDRGIVMFFVGLLVLSVFVVVKLVMDVCGVKV